MFDMTNEQEEIINTLKKMDDGDVDATYFRIANWVINDRKRIVEPLVKYLKRMNGSKSINESHEAILETLKLAGEL